MAAAGSERPARTTGSGGSGGDGDGEVLMTRVSGEPCSDKGGRKSLIMLSWGPATAFLFPLSTFGIPFSSLKRGCDFSSLGAPSAKLIAFFWISLNLRAIRSNIVAVLQVCHEGHVPLRTLFGSNLPSSSASSALRTLERYMFLCLRTCTREPQQGVKVGRTFAPRLELVRNS